MRLLATGFGPFGKFATNPSGELVRGLGLPYQILDVTFEAVDAFVASDVLDGYDALLMFGVAGKGTEIVLETRGRNSIGALADASGSVQGPGPIDPSLPANLASTLWVGPQFWGSPHWGESVDAGDYLCNYLLFSVIANWPAILAGFVHIPPFEVVPADQQAQALAELVSLFTETPSTLTHA